MSTFQAAFLNEVIYVTNARFKESRDARQLLKGIEDQGRALVDKEGLKKKGKLTQLKVTTLLVLVSIVERPIGPVKVSFLTQLRKTGFAATRMPFLISQRQDLQQSPTTLRESTQLAC